jgi:hypothetical protein
MAEHFLKVQPPYMDALLDGTKTFEVRKNDRGYQKGDTLRLVAFDGRYRMHAGCGNANGCDKCAVTKEVAFVYSGVILASVADLRPASWCSGSAVSHDSPPPLRPPRGLVQPDMRRGVGGRRELHGVRRAAPDAGGRTHPPPAVRVDPVRSLLPGVGRPVQRSRRQQGGAVMTINWPALWCLAFFVLGFTAGRLW